MLCVVLCLHVCVCVCVCHRGSEMHSQSVAEIAAALCACLSCLVVNEKAKWTVVCAGVCRLLCAAAAAGRTCVVVTYVSCVWCRQSLQADVVQCCVF